MKLLGIAAGFVLAFACMGVGGLMVVEFGLFDDRAITPHSAPTAWATHTTMIHASQNFARGIAAPAAFTPAQVTAGFRLYDADCAVCHGGPGVDRQAWASGLNPTPPYLVDAARHWSAPELYVVVGDGVKMTGMPAWKLSMSDAEVWDVVAFLEAMPYLTAQDYLKMRAAVATAEPAKAGT